LTIVLGDHRFLVHKAIVAQSTVLKDAIVDPRCHEIDVTGRSHHTPEAMKSLLDCLYSRDCADAVLAGVDKARLVLPLASFYNCVPVLQTAIKQIVEKSPAIFNDLHFALGLPLSELQQKIIEKISRNKDALRVARDSVPEDKRAEMWQSLPGGIINEMFNTSLGRTPRSRIITSYDGLLNLEVGDIVDASDRGGVWYQSTVMVVEPERYLIHFEGWSPQFDEWVGKRDGRVAPLATRAPQLRPAHNPVTEFSSFLKERFKQQGASLPLRSAVPY